MSQLDQSLLIIVIVYVLAVIGISLYRALQAQEMGDHVLAGRRVGPITTGLSASSSLEQGWALFILPAIAVGFRYFIVGFAVASMIGLWACWKTVAPRLRRFTFAAQNSLTLPEFFERRFNDRTGVLRVLAAVLTFLFVLFYVSAAIMAGAAILKTAFGVSTAIGGLITIIVVLAYIFLGGYLVVARTDVLQGLITLVGIVVLTVAVIAATESPTEGIADSFRITTDSPADWIIALVFLLFLVAFAQGVFGAQRLLHRFMAAKSEAIMDTSRRISMLWAILTAGFTTLLGLFAVNAFTEREIDLDSLGISGSQIFSGGVDFYYTLTNLIESPFLGALGLAAVIATVMSTMDSQLLIGASVATGDLPVVRRYAQRRRFEFVLGAFMRVWIGRCMLVLIGIIAWLIAIGQPTAIATFLIYGWLGMGGTFAPVVLLSLYWRRFNFQGALTALVAGGLLTVFSVALNLNVIYFGVATLFVLPLAVLVTLVTKAPSAEVEKAFDQGLIETKVA